MFPSQALRQYASFSGSAEELIGVINQVTDAVRMGIGPGEANERLIRHYVAVRVLDRPERMGKGVVYGYRHLLQYLVARRLLGNGFQLAKIAEYTGRVPTAALLKSLDGAPQRSEAQLLIEAYGARAEMGAEDIKPRPSKPSIAASRPPYPSKREPSIHASAGDADRMLAFQATAPSATSSEPAQPEPVLSMIDLADRFERTSREQREQFAMLSRRLEQQVDYRLIDLEKQLSISAMSHGLQGSDESRKQLLQLQDEMRAIYREMEQMHRALRHELHAHLETFAAQQQEQSERLLHELVGRLERVLRHQEDTERSLAEVRNDLWALQQAVGGQPPNKDNTKQDDDKDKGEEGGKP